MWLLAVEFGTVWPRIYASVKFLFISVWPWTVVDFSAALLIPPLSYIRLQADFANGLLLEETIQVFVRMAMWRSWLCNDVATGGSRFQSGFVSWFAVRFQGRKFESGASSLKRRFCIFAGVFEVRRCWAFFRVFSFQVLGVFWGKFYAGRLPSLSYNKFIILFHNIAMSFFGLEKDIDKINKLNDLLTTINLSRIFIFL